MKICVLNGSPKGERGITLQYALYMQKKFPEHTFTVLHVARDIKKIENDPGVFEEAVKAVRESDGVIWAYPLYVMLVHADLKRFIELIFERNAAGAFESKYAALVSTSIHFFDHTANYYMQAICGDLGMRYAGCFSAKMDELMRDEGQEKFLCFARGFLASMAGGEATPREIAPVKEERIDYTPSPVGAPLGVDGIRVLVLTDCMDEDTNIGKMVKRFSALTGADVIDISSLKIVSGCIGCIGCAFDNVCVFAGRDDVEETYAKMGEYDAIIFAGEMKDRYLSALWKRFIDRRFFKNHAPHYPGKQIAYLISGPFSRNANLLEIFDGMAQLEDSNYCGVLSDEYASSSEIDMRMDTLAKKIIRYAAEKYIAPQSFPGVAGRKLFRDEIWGAMRFPFRMDYRYYKRHGYYDFPQKDIRSRVQNSFMLFLIRFPKMKKNIQSQMTRYMVKPYQELLDDK